MTADLREAFHIAAVTYVGWHRVNEQQRWQGWRDLKTGQRAYQPEPAVTFFGRPLSLSEICRHAAVLSGELPLHIRELFQVIDDGAGEPLPATYPEAVEALEASIDCELALQAEAPVSQPTILDQIRTCSFREGLNTGLGITAGKAGSA